MISVCSDEDIRPMLASHLNIAEYGEQLEVASLIHCQNISSMNISAESYTYFTNRQQKSSTGNSVY
jgi:hypothetical protein